MTSPGPNAILEFFEERLMLLAETLSAHVNDGGYCRGCSWQSRPQLWPCLMRYYADLAATHLRKTQAHHPLLGG